MKHKIAVLIASKDLSDSTRDVVICYLRGIDHVVHHGFSCDDSSDNAVTSAIYASKNIDFDAAHYMTTISFHHTQKKRRAHSRLALGKRKLVAPLMNYMTMLIVHGETDQFGTIAGITPVDDYSEIADCDTFFECCTYPMLF